MSITSAEIGAWVLTSVAPANPIQINEPLLEWRGGIGFTLSFNIVPDLEMMSLAGPDVPVIYAGDPAGSYNWMVSWGPSGLSFKTFGGMVDITAPLSYFGDTTYTNFVQVRVTIEGLYLDGELVAPARLDACHVGRVFGGNCVFGAGYQQLFRGTVNGVSVTNSSAAWFDVCLAIQNGRDTLVGTDVSGVPVARKNVRLAVDALVADGWFVKRRDPYILNFYADMKALVAPTYQFVSGGDDPVSFGLAAPCEWTPTSKVDIEFSFYTYCTPPTSGFRNIVRFGDPAYALHNNWAIQWYPVRTHPITGEYVSGGLVLTLGQGATVVSQTTLVEAMTAGFSAVYSIHITNTNVVVNGRTAHTFTPEDLAFIGSEAGYEVILGGYVNEPFLGSITMSSVAAGADNIAAAILAKATGQIVRVNVTAPDAMLAVNIPCSRVGNYVIKVITSTSDAVFSVNDANGGFLVYRDYGGPEYTETYTFVNTESTSITVYMSLFGGSLGYYDASVMYYSREALAVLMDEAKANTIANINDVYPRAPQNRLAGVTPITFPPVVLREGIPSRIPEMRNTYGYFAVFILNLDEVGAYEFGFAGNYASYEVAHHARLYRVDPDDLTNIQTAASAGGAGYDSFASDIGSWHAGTTLFVDTPQVYFLVVTASYLWGEALLSPNSVCYKKHAKMWAGGGDSFGWGTSAVAGAGTDYQRYVEAVGVARRERLALEAAPTPELLRSYAEFTDAAQAARTPLLSPLVDAVGCSGNIDLPGVLYLCDDPISRVVRIYDYDSGELIKTDFSGDDGVFLFTGVSSGEYFITAHDVGVDNPSVIIKNVTI